ncbi:MAG: hypothetical protein MZV70_60960 [Desulfobacterales bacterium]|nr:hypothetical protein [Desulfobacterales bacterium]
MKDDVQTHFHILESSEAERRSGLNRRWIKAPYGGVESPQRPGPARRGPAGAGGGAFPGRAHPRRWKSCCCPPRCTWRPSPDCS